MKSPGLVTRALACAVLVAACTGGAPSAGSTQQPSTDASTASPPTSTPSPTAQPAASAVASALTGSLPPGRIVFGRLQGSPEGDFLGTSIMGTDGVVRPVALPIPSFGSSAVFSPDGSQLLITAFDGTNLVVGIYDLTGETWTELEPKGMTHELDCSAWARDGKSVICGRGGPDPSDDGIYVVQIATGKTTRLTSSPYHHVTGTAGECGGGEGRALYSPDGTRIAFQQQRCGNGPDPSSDEQGNLVIADADGSSQQEIVPFGGIRTHAGGDISWSPIDDVIAFGTQDGVLSLVNADGTDLRTLHLPVRGFVYGPTWSPDGKWLLVTINPLTTNQADLFVVAADGSSAIRLTANREVEASTDWAP